MGVMEMGLYSEQFRGGFILGTGVLMGLYSEQIRGGFTLGTGVILLVIHCVGTIDCFREKLNKWQSGSENDEAAIWRNQCGRLSRPAEVCLI